MDSVEKILVFLDTDYIHEQLEYYKDTEYDAIPLEIREGVIRKIAASLRAWFHKYKFEQSYGILDANSAIIDIRCAKHAAKAFKIAVDNNEIAGVKSAILISRWMRRNHKINRQAEKISAIRSANGEIKRCVKCPANLGDIVTTLALIKAHVPRNFLIYLHIFLAAHLSTGRLH